MTIMKWFNSYITLVLPSLILLITLFLTYLAFAATLNKLEQNTQIYFDFRVREATQNIYSRIEKYRQVLYSVRGLFKGSETVGRDEFNQYVSSLALDLNYIGIQGVGLSLIVPSAKKIQHIASIRSEGFPDYTIWPEGQHDIYSSIIYIEPFTHPNLFAFGYDMFNDSVRHTAMQNSIDSGSSQLSGKVKLIQDAGKQDQVGVLMYLPFYRNGTNNDTQAERRAHIIGWLYSPYRMTTFMDGIFGEYADDLNIQIFDGEIMSNETKIYDSTTLEPLSTNKHKATQRLQVSGQTWTVVIRSLASMEPRINAISPTLIASIGIIISALLSLLTWFLISGRQRAQYTANEMNKVLLAERQRLNDIIDGTGAGTWEWNIQGGQFKIDEQWALILGYKLNELQPITIETWMRLVHWDDLILSKALLAKHYSGELAYYETESRLRHKDGHWIWVIDRGKVKTWTADGKPLVMYGTHQDITERKVATQQLQDGVARISAILNTAVDSIITTNEGGTIESINPATKRIFGYSAAKLIGQNMKMLMPEEYHSQHDDYLKHYKTTGESRVIGTERFAEGLREDGTVFPLELAISTMQLGKKQLFTIIARDVTDQKQAEQSVIAMMTVAIAANDAKSEFLAIMSHEIRTPMNGVIGMVDVLQQTSLRGVQLDMVNTIRDSAYSLLTIIEDILDISKIEAGKLEIEHEPISIAKVVEKVCIMLDQVAEQKGVELTLFTDPAIPEITLGDASRLRQIVLNLVNNAIKFSSESGRFSRVYVKAVMTDFSMLEIRVADNGIGIDESKLARLFTPFEQADITTTRRFGGTGLGLTIASNLVQLMGGEITVQSALNKGSTFSVHLPLKVPSGEALEQLQAKARTEINTDLLTGISCVLIGDAGERVDDLAIYLTAAGVIVEQRDSLAEAQQHIVTPRGELSIWMIDASNSVLLLDELRDIASAQPERAIHFVIIGRGRRRRPRWLEVDSIVGVDGNILTQQTVLQSLEIAAGLSQPRDERLYRGESEHVFAVPLRSDALAQDRLILIAEDNETNQKVILQQLGLLGFAADITSNGIEAFQRWQSGNYALLFTDLHMPKMDGYQLTAAIRDKENNRSHIPIIALTANALKSEAKKCLDGGMDDYLTKPTPIANLSLILEKWLPVAAEKPVDISVLAALVGDYHDIIRDFLQDFNHSASQISLELITACRSGQVEQASAAAHKLKSSAASVGALVLSELCEEVEQAAKSGQLKALAVLLPHFEAEMAAVRKYLDKFYEADIPNKVITRANHD